MTAKQKTIGELEKIPNVSPRIAEDLYSLGFRSISDMKGKKPDELYAKLGELSSKRIERSTLYILRSLVFMAQTGERDPEVVAWQEFRDVQKPKKSKI